MKSIMTRALACTLTMFLGGCATETVAPTESVESAESLETGTTSSELLQLFAVDGSVGHADLDWALVDVPKAVAESLLPPELALADQPLTDADHYRIGIAFGKHQRVRATLDVFSLLTFNYNEFFLFMPAVKFKNWNPCANSHAGTYAFMPNLYLDDVAPTLIGWIYGYNKELAKFGAAGSTRTITKGGVPRVSKVAGPDTASDAAGSEVATKFLSVASGSNPFGTVTMIGKNKFGLYEISDLKWTVPSIVTRSVDLHLELKRPFGQLGPAVYDVDGIAHGGTGFRMEYDWTLRSPIACVGL